ncbi:MAG: HlyD family efflux transporter periplasmic adaptor subunit [Pseudomonadota bacterium]
MAVTFLVTAVFWCVALVASDAQDADRQVSGLVVSRSEIMLSSQVAATIQDMPFRRGQAFAKGDTLVEFDCAVMLAERDAQLERRISADQRYETAQRLGRSGAVAKGDLLLAQSDAKIAAAELRAIEAQLRGCTIAAPFSGRVVDTFASRFENVRQAQELISIVDRENLEIELIVPSNWLRWLQPGSQFRYTIFENEEVYTAKVFAIGATVDPVSRTIAIFAKFTATPTDVLPGMTGVASFGEG